MALGSWTPNFFLPQIILYSKAAMSKLNESSHYLHVLRKAAEKIFIVSQENICGEFKSSQ